MQPERSTSSGSQGCERSRQANTMKEVLIHGKEWTAKIDTEADLSVISEETASA